MNLEYWQKNGLFPHVGLELEWYALPRTGTQPMGQEILAYLLFACNQADIPIYSMQVETTPQQYEIALPPLPVQESIQNYHRLRRVLRQVHQRLHHRLILHPKPFADKPGSGLHVHISLHDVSGHNLFQQPKANVETSHMRYALGGLCAHMKADMPIFAPHRWSWKRFETARNVPLGSAVELAHYNLAPTHVCWGVNNRTAALRIPTSTRYPATRRIEHRVPGSDARIEPVIQTILNAMEQGLRNKIHPPEKLHGNAFDPQYGLEPLC